MSINAGGWHKETREIKQHVEQNKHLYGSASISKIMSKGTNGLEGTAYVGRVFKNLGDVLHVKFARLLHRFSEGEWVNNKTVRGDLNKKIKELTDLVKGPKLKHLSEEDKALVKQGIAEMQAVCVLLKKRGIKDIDPISKQLERALLQTLPNKVKIPEGLEEQIANRKIGVSTKKFSLSNAQASQTFSPQLEEVNKEVVPVKQKDISDIENVKLVVTHKDGLLLVNMKGILKNLNGILQKDPGFIKSLGWFFGKDSNDNRKLQKLIKEPYDLLTPSEFRKNLKEIIRLVEKGYSNNVPKNVSDILNELKKPIDVSESKRKLASLTAFGIHLLTKPINNYANILDVLSSEDKGSIEKIIGTNFRKFNKRGNLVKDSNNFSRKEIKNNFKVIVEILERNLKNRTSEKEAEELITQLKAESKEWLSELKYAEEIQSG